MRTDTARIIVGMWLSGKHLEDIKEIPPTEFGELEHVVAALRTGETDLLKIARMAGVSPGAIVSMTRDTTDIFYGLAMMDLLKTRRIERLAEHPDASPDEIVRLLEPERRLGVYGLPKSDMTETVRNYYEALSNRKNAAKVCTGIKQLDDLTGGIIPGTLTAIGGRPGTGKSAFCLQTAVNVAKHGHRVLFFSLEMNEEQNMDRLIMMFSKGIDNKDLRDGNLSEEQMKEIHTVGNAICKRIAPNISFYQTNDLNTIEAIIDRDRPTLVIIDQLSQLSDKTVRFSDIRGRFVHMTQALKRISLNYNTAIWLACQLSREAPKASKPTMDYFKESGSIEEDSDVAVILYRDDRTGQYSGLNGNRIVNVTMPKQRQGSEGDFKLQFIVKRFSFVELNEMLTEEAIEKQEKIDF